jgi:DNA-binding GntR family transcriptional regulator
MVKLPQPVTLRTVRLAELGERSAVRNDRCIMDATGRPSAADRVYEHVRQGILGRRYADNDLLAEGDIAAETGVSRTPVREALLRLESQGMVRLLPKRGALVLPVTAQEWRDVLATRLLVESHCTRSAISSGRGAVVARALAVPLADLRAAAEAADVERYVAADRTFHATIVAAENNMILIRLYGSLRDRQLRMGAANLLRCDGAVDLDRMRTTVADHEAIAAAIGDADLELADRLTSEHLAHADRALRGASA